MDKTRCKLVIVTCGYCGTDIICKPNEKYVVCHACGKKVKITEKNSRMVDAIKV